MKKRIVYMGGYGGRKFVAKVQSRAPENMEVFDGTQDYDHILDPVRFQNDVSTKAQVIPTVDRFVFIIDSPLDSLHYCMAAMAAGSKKQMCVVFLDGSVGTFRNMLADVLTAHNVTQFDNVDAAIEWLLTTD